MAEAPQPFGAYLLVERLRGARHTFRALARGGAAEVGAAGSAVALKRLGPGQKRPTAARLPALYHPNLAAPLCLGACGAELFLVTELIEGRSLEELLRAGPLPLGVAVRVVANVARGLGVLHAARIDGSHLVHRRVGPRTVLVTPTGRVVLCGLDEALAPAARGAERAPWGPLAPEQLLGEPLDARTDVFALGELLRLSLGITETHGVLGAPGSTGAPLPPPLQGLVERCRAVQRAARPASASEVEVELRDWLARLPVPVGAGELAAELAARPPLAALELALDADAAPGVTAADPSVERLDDGEPAPPPRGTAPRHTFLGRAPAALPDDGALAAGPPDGSGGPPDGAAAPELGEPGQRVAASNRAPSTRPAAPDAASASRPPRAGTSGRRTVLLLGSALLVAALATALARRPRQPGGAPPRGAALPAAGAQALSARSLSLVDSAAAAERVAEGVGGWLRTTPLGESAVLGPLRLRVAASRCDAGAAEVRLLLENHGSAPVARPLASLRAGGAAAAAAIHLTVEPDVESLRPGAAVEVTARAVFAAPHPAPASPAPGSAPGAAPRRLTLELPGVSLAACTEPTP